MLREEQLPTNDTNKHADKGESQGQLELLGENTPKAGEPGRIVPTKAGDLRGEVREPGNNIVQPRKHLVKQADDPGDDFPGKSAQL